MGLTIRIAALERRFLPAEAPCPRCGRPMDTSRDSREFRVVFDDDSPPEPDEECLGCGRRRVYRIEFDKGG